ncbi:hypothetical protein FRC12_016154 [Ceratobasidium sp. 428]|nr:hypothetical protein FRC12_016154 [Ceratobasidium sp. 428]
MENFTSYVVRSFIPKTFGRLCVMGVDLVGVPVLLLYGLPENKILLVAGWFGLRIALTGIGYLESRGNKAPTLNIRVLHSQDVSSSAIDLAASNASSSKETVTSLNCEDLKVSADSLAPIENDYVHVEGDALEPIAGVEFPRTEKEPEAIATDVNTRTARTVSMSSTDSNVSSGSNATSSDWEPLTTPPQALVELPAESDDMDESDLVTPKPDGVSFSVYQEDSPDLCDSLMSRGQFLDLDAAPVETSSPPRRRAPTRKKSTKYGSCPLLIPKRSNPSLQLSEVKYDKPAEFTA